MFFTWADNVAKKFGWIDVKLLGIVGVMIGFILVKLFPGILNVSIWWWIIIAIILYIKPVSKMFK